MMNKNTRDDVTTEDDEVKKFNKFPLLQNTINRDNRNENTIKFWVGITSYATIYDRYMDQVIKLANKRDNNVTNVNLTSYKS